MKLSELLRGVEKVKVQGGLDLEITGLSHDSRNVRPGDVFFAMHGEKTDGNRFLKDAAGRGATAVVSELEAPPAPASLSAVWVQVKDAHEALSSAAANFFGHPSAAMKVVGITGTNGKTTTAYFLESILRRAGRPTGVVGTVNYRFEGAEISKAPNTTPLALELQGLFADFKRRGATDVVMEVSSHALALKRVEEIEFDAAVFTNLYRDHLDFHKTKDEYFAAKRRLFELLSRSPKPGRTAVLNADDARFAALKEASRGVKVVAYGLGPAAEFRAESVALSPQGTSFALRWEGRERPVRLLLIGRHNVYNALAAGAAAAASGVPIGTVIEGLETLRSVPGRLEPVDGGQDFTVVVDYAHTDSALEIVLENLKILPHKRTITVIGCGGDRDRTKRGPMGLAACRGSDLAVITSDNPRSEEPDRIIADIVEGLKAAGAANYVVEPDRRKAVFRAIGEARTGDLVLIAGKGHEDYQILKDRTIRFDDRETALEALRERLAAR